MKISKFKVFVTPSTSSLIIGVKYLIFFPNFNSLNGFHWACSQETNDKV